MADFLPDDGNNWIRELYSETRPIAPKMPLSAVSGWRGGAPINQMQINSPAMNSLMQGPRDEPMGLNLEAPRANMAPALPPIPPQSPVMPRQLTVPTRPITPPLGPFPAITANPGVTGSAVDAMQNIHSMLPRIMSRSTEQLRAPPVSEPSVALEPMPPRPVPTIPPFGEATVAREPMRRRNPFDIPHELEQRFIQRGGNRQQLDRFMTNYDRIFPHRRPEATWDGRTIQVPDRSHPAYRQGILDFLSGNRR